MHFQNKTVFITGASSGIGEALSRELASQGADLVLVARRKDRLEKLAQELGQRGIRAVAVEGDVTSEESMQGARKAAVDHFGKIDIVIANAGFGVAATFSRLTLEDYRRQFETNVFGLLRTLYATFEDVKKSRGQFVLVGSVASHVSIPGGSPYSMSKFAVRALAESIGAELAPKGISVTLISPGFVESEIRMVDNQGKYRPDADPIPHWIVVPADRAAREIARAIRKKKKEAIITGHGKLIVFFNRLFPGLMNWVKFLGLRGRAEPGRAKQSSH